MAKKQRVKTALMSVTMMAPEDLSPPMTQTTETIIQANLKLEYFSRKEIPGGE